MENDQEIIQMIGTEFIDEMAASIEEAKSQGVFTALQVSFRTYFYML